MSASPFPRFEALPYVEESSRYFDALKDLDWPVFLDSGGRLNGRSDIIAAAPCRKLVTRGDTTLILGEGNVSESRQDPFLLVREAVGEPAGHFTPLAFEGGAIGYFGYDLGRRLDHLVVPVNVGDRATVRHHVGLVAVGAAKAPFLAQDLLEQSETGAAGLAVGAVVGAHDGVGAGLLHAGLEGGEVGLGHVAGRGDRLEIGIHHATASSSARRALSMSGPPIPIAESRRPAVARSAPSIAEVSSMS